MKSNQLNSTQIKSNQILVFEERGKPEYLEKNLSEQSREPTQPTFDAESGNRTRATLVGGERSDTAPTLLPQSDDRTPKLVNWLIFRSFL